jgi:Flp pilus assembly protein TadD
MLAGCASSARQPGLAAKFVRPAPPDSTAAPAPYDAEPPEDSLEAVMGKIRELSVRAKPAPKYSAGTTLESLDGRLAAALLALKMLPGAETHRRVADEYARIRVLDAAHTHYRAAIRLDPRDAAAHDGLARLWRDAGLPALAVGDAQRAVYHAPRSPQALNTLGTVLQALGQDKAAKQAYERALAIDPVAAYALNNLGYLALVQGKTEKAIQYCLRASGADATLIAARHNLALAYAASGRMDLVRQTLRDAGPIARADYNEGIINLSLRRPVAALAAFEAACNRRRRLTRASARRR